MTADKTNDIDWKKEFSRRFTPKRFARDYPKSMSEQMLETFERVLRCRLREVNKIPDSLEEKETKWKTT
jgi:hypothetical protein